MPLFIGWERGISERWSGKQTESFFFRDTVILSSSYSSSSVRLLWRHISYILMMNMKLQWSYKELWSQVAHNWQRDLPRWTARQIVILPANLTLSSERLMFLGKSHSTCCPVSSLQLARAYEWMTEWRKMGSSQLVRRREWEGCGWRIGQGLVQGCLFDWTSSHPTSGSFSPLSNASLPLWCLWQRNSNYLEAADTSLANNRAECHSVSATLKSPQVPSPRTKTVTFDNRTQAWGIRWFVSAIFFTLIFLDFRTN